MRPPLERINGKLEPVEGEPLAPDTIEDMLESVIPGHLRGRLERDLAIEFGYGIPGVSRFRAAVFHQRGTLAAVFFAGSRPRRYLCLGAAAVCISVPFLKTDGYYDFNFHMNKRDIKIVEQDTEVTIWDPISRIDVINYLPRSRWIA